MSLWGSLRAYHEARLKAIRDQRAQENYVKEVAMREGMEKGMAEGEARGEARGLKGLVDICISFGLDFEDTCRKVHSTKGYENASVESIQKYYNELSA